MVLLHVIYNNIGIPYFVRLSILFLQMSKQYQKQSSSVVPNSNTISAGSQDVENANSRSIKRGMYSSHRKKNQNGEVLHGTKAFRCPGTTTSSHNVNNGNPNTNIAKVGGICRLSKFKFK